MGRVEAPRGVGKEDWFATNTVAGSGKVAASGKFFNFAPYLSLETVVPIKSSRLPES